MRDVVVNRINIVSAMTVGAIAARSVQSDVNSFLFAIGAGLSSAMLPMSGRYFTAHDENGLTRLCESAVKISAALSFSAALLVAVFSGTIARFYTDNAETASLIVYGLLWVSAGIVTDTLLSLFQSYLQGIQNRKLVTFVCFTERFFAPVLVALGLGAAWGSKGVLASTAIGEFLLALVVLVIAGVRGRRFPRKIRDFMFIPDDFGGEPNDSLCLTVADADSLADVCRQVEDFGLKHAFPASVAYHMSLCAEEIAGNVFEHGRRVRRRKAVVDVRVHAEKCDEGSVFTVDGLQSYNVSIALLDNCRPFNPKAYYERYHGREKNMTGLETVFRLAKDVTYVNTFGINEVVVMF